MGDGAPWSFETEPGTVAPSVLRTGPGHGDSRVEADAVVTIRFSEAMDTAATEGAFSLTGVGEVEGTPSWSDGDRKLTFTPPAELDWSTTYTVTITTGPGGATGTAAPPNPNPLDASNSPIDAGGDYAFSFTTAEALTGLAAGEGCVPALPLGQTGAGLGLAVIALAAAGRLLRRRRR